MSARKVPTARSKKGKLDILLLGSYEPPMERLEERYKAGEPRPQQKLQEKQPLYPMEMLVLLAEKVAELGHTPVLASKTRRDIRNVYYRVARLIDETDLVLILVANVGGVAVEQGMILATNSFWKSIFFVDIRNLSELSGMIRQGILADPRVPKIYFQNDSDLLDLMPRAVEAFQEERFLSDLGQ